MTYYHDPQDPVPEPARPTGWWRAANWGLNASTLMVIVMTILYVISPVDAVPDVVPLAGQADDLAAILAGGTSATLLTAGRYLLRFRAARWACGIAGFLALLGLMTLLWLAYQVVNWAVG